MFAARHLAGLTALLAASALAGVLSLCFADGPTSNAPASRPFANVPPLNRPDPNDNLDYWLHKASSQPATTTAPAATSEPAGAATDAPSREDALPGVVELSNGQQMPGYLYTTRDKDWELYVEADKNYHRIPFIAVLSITANVVEEGKELEWRWKAMGVPEKVYTGRSYPTRRCTWTFHLIDGTRVTGAIKGQPLWIEYQGGKTGPLVIHERDKGELGQTLKDLVYIRQIIVSKRMMEAVAKATPASRPTTRKTYERD